MSGDTPTQDLDRLAAFFGDGVAWSMPDDERWFGEDFTGSEVVDRLRAEVGRLTGRAEWAERERDQAVQESDHMSTEVGRLTPDTPGEVSDHVRARFAEASAATLAGEGGCIGAGCIPAHQACEVLDAYDDARADHSREVLGLLSNAEAVKVQHEARVDRLDREVGTHRSTIGDLETRLLAEEVTVAALEQERDAWIFAARTGRWRELLGLAPDVGDVNAWGESVRERAAFDAVRECSTTDEPGGDQ